MGGGPRPLARGNHLRMVANSTHSSRLFDESFKPKLKCKRDTHDSTLSRKTMGAQRSTLKTVSWVSVTPGIERCSCGLKSFFLACQEGAKKSHEGGSESEPAKTQGNRSPHMK